MEQDVIRVAVAGAAGRMGREVVRAVQNAEGMVLVAAVDRFHLGEDIGTLVGSGPCGVGITDALDTALEASGAQVLIDFTLPDSVLVNVRQALSRGISAVVGTTGLSKADLDSLDVLARTNGAGLFVAPNFAIGAVLMMQFAEQAAKYLPDVEIIELHHDRKVDSPATVGPTACGLLTRPSA